jgi:hypothetical protein
VRLGDFLTAEFGFLLLLRQEDVLDELAVFQPLFELVLALDVLELLLLLLLEVLLFDLLDPGVLLVLGDGMGLGFRSIPAVELLLLLHDDVPSFVLLNISEIDVLPLLNYLLLLFNFDGLSGDGLLHLQYFVLLLELQQ